MRSWQGLGPRSASTSLRSSLASTSDGSIAHGNGLGRTHPSASVVGGFPNLPLLDEAGPCRVAASGVETEGQPLLTAAEGNDDIEALPKDPVALPRAELMQSGPDWYRLAKWRTGSC